MAPTTLPVDRFVALPDWADDKEYERAQRSKIDLLAKGSKDAGGDYEGAKRIYQRVAVRYDKRTGRG